VSRYTSHNPLQVKRTGVTAQDCAPVFSRYTFSRDGLAMIHCK